MLVPKHFVFDSMMEQLSLSNISSNPGLKGDAQKVARPLALR